MKKSERIQKKYSEIVNMIFIIDSIYDKRKSCETHSKDEISIIIFSCRSESLKSD